MAKKKKKARKPIMPPLSFLDKSIYIALIVIDIIVCFAFAVLGDIVKYHIAFHDSAVIASRDTIGGLLIIPFLLFLLLFGFIPIIDRLGAKTPIFGKKGVTYGPPLYDKKYPLFMKNKPSVYVKPSEKKWQKTKRILVFAVLIITLIPVGFSICGRQCLTRNTTLEKYNAVNIKTAEYALDEIKSVTFRAYYRPNISLKSATGYWTVSVKFTTDNNKKFQFDFSDFSPYGNVSYADTLHLLLDVKSKLPPERIEYIGTDNLDIVAENKGFDEKETELLYKLFDL